MNNFFIGIPTINRADLLNAALEKYNIDFPSIDIFIIDNGNQNIFLHNNKTHIIKMHKNIGVAASWNWFFNTGKELGYTHGLILNDDIYLGKNENEIFDFLNSEENLKYGFFKSTQHWCAYILSLQTFNRVGEFDESFYPAYFEDNDYHYRMLLKYVNNLETEFLNPKIYRNSMTIIKDRSLNNNFQNNQDRYLKKWGGLPNNEIYKKPFNNNIK